MTAASFGRRGVARDPAPRAQRQAAAVEAAGMDERPHFALDDAASAQKLIAYLPLFTAGLVVLLFVIFAVQRRYAFDIGKGGEISLDSLIAFGAASYDLVIVDRQVWRVFLAPLLHSDFSHVAGNCVALALAGFPLERRLGRGWYAAIFVLSALTGMAGSLMSNPHAIPTVGASGAITGVIAALFVVSYHNQCDPVEREAMQRWALRLGVPALGPILYSASSGVDYAAHLGGAIGGGALAFVVTSAWTGHGFRPPHAVAAGYAALQGLCLATISVFPASAQYKAAALIAAERMPARLMPDDMNKGAKASADLVFRYPKGPKSHFLRAHALVLQDELHGAEAELRKAIALSTKPADKGTRAAANAYLALVLLERGARAEAIDRAKEGCGTKEASQIAKMLRAAKLCG
jgi:rhomboid protease GluP